MSTGCAAQVQADIDGMLDAALAGIDDLPPENKLFTGLRGLADLAESVPAWDQIVRNVERCMQMLSYGRVDLDVFRKVLDLATYTVNTTTSSSDVRTSAHEYIEQALSELPPIDEELQARIAAARSKRGAK